MGTCGGSLGDIGRVGGSLGDVGRVGGALWRLRQSCGWLASITLRYISCQCGLALGRGLLEGCCDWI